MSRRIAIAIVGVTAVVLVGLGVPLAIVVHHTIVQSEIVELQADAARVLAYVPVPLRGSDLADLTAPDDHQGVTVYDIDGRRLVGDGPLEPDALTRTALAGRPVASDGDQVVVANPITDGADGRVVGALRLHEGRSEIIERTRVALLVMAAAAVVALGLAWVIARAVANRLARPVRHLAGLAVLIGEGRVVDQPPPTHVAELDALGVTLAESSRQAHETLARERRFSADVSHQLRTPLTHLRLTLEHLRSDSGGQAAVSSCLGDVERIESTVQHLLAFARESTPSGATTDLAAAADEAAQRWRIQAETRSREIEVAVDGGDQPHVAQTSRVAIDQAVDVLIDNALRYGAGTVRLRVRKLAGGVALDVTDEGEQPLDDRVFERGTGRGSGIGLALARSITEAEGGRLLLSKKQPPVFTIIHLDSPG